MSRLPSDPAAAAFLRRGRNARVVPRRRGPGRAGAFLLLLFGLGLLSGGVYAGLNHVRNSPRFRVRRIDLAATRRAPAREIRRIAERQRGRNLFRVDVARLAREIEAHRWVRRATVKRVLPDRLFVAVEEREPRGLALLRGTVMLVDADGVPLDPNGAAGAAYSFPIFTGLDERDAARARRQAARGTALLQHLDRHHPELAREISTIDLAREDRVVLTMNDGGPAVRLHPTDFGTNLDRYETMRRYLATNFGDGEYVDLRFRDRIAFRPAPAREP